MPIVCLSHLARAAAGRRAASASSSAPARLHALRSRKSSVKCVHCVLNSTLEELDEGLLVPPKETRALAVSSCPGASQLVLQEAMMSRRSRRTKPSGEGWSRDEAIRVPTERIEVKRWHGDGKAV